MTNEEAKVFLDNLKICINEHPVVADWLVEIADRKTENSSEKPNNCEHITEDGVTCAKYPACDDCLDNPLNKVKGSERLLKGKDEPQTDIHDLTDCDFCKDRNCKDCEGGKDEPQTNKDFKVTYTCSFTECDNFKNFGFGEKCIECKRKQSEAKHKDEPQTNADQHVQHVESVETMSCQECKHWIYDDRWGWFCPLKSQDECKYEPKDLEQFRVGLEYHTDTTHFGKTKGESVATNKIEDEPQTDCGDEVEWVYNKRERLWYPYSNGELLFKDKPTTQTETQNSNLTFKTLEYCDICDHKGCEECISNALDEYCVPSHYHKVEDEPQTDCAWK